MTNLRTGALKERIYHSNEIASTSSPTLQRRRRKNNPRKGRRCSEAICENLPLFHPLFYSTQSLSRPLSSSRGSYRQFSSSSSSRARAAPTPQRYSKHTQQSSPTLPLQICSHLSSAPPAAAPSSSSSSSLRRWTHDI